MKQKQQQQRKIASCEKHLNRISGENIKYLLFHMCVKHHRGNLFWFNRILHACTQQPKL